MTAKDGLSRLDDILVKVLEWVEAIWVTSSEIEALADQYSPPSIDGKIYLLRELLDIVRCIPTTIYEDVDHRTRLIEAAQEALDAAIESEEESIDA